MSHEQPKTRPMTERKSSEKKDLSSRTSKKKEIQQNLSSFDDILNAAHQIDPQKTKAFDAYVALFDAIRVLNGISNQQIDIFFAFVEQALGNMWLHFLTKLTVSICTTKCENDAKLIPAIRTKCKDRMANHSILESSLSNAERNLCLLNDGSFVTQFLHEALKQNAKASEHPIANEDLARISFICFTLHCKNYYENINDRVKTQLLIDRAIAEFFSAKELTGIKDKELAGKTIGNILVSKSYSQKRLSELTYLYSWTNEHILSQNERIKTLESNQKAQRERIDKLSTEITNINSSYLEAEQRNALLEIQAQQLREERDAAENMLAYEKNKFETQLRSQEVGLADQLSADIDLELQALRDLVEYLDEPDQKRFRRRLDRIDRFLREFGGEQ